MYPSEGPTLISTSSRNVSSETGTSYRPSVVLVRTGRKEVPLGLNPKKFLFVTLFSKPYGRLNPVC